MVSIAGNSTQSPYKNRPNPIKSHNINRVASAIIKACSAGINKRNVAAKWLQMLKSYVVGYTKLVGSVT